MTMMEDFNQYPQTMAQPIAQQVQPMAQPSSFAPSGGMLGERIDERMEWQSPARDQIIRNDLGLNPATLGAGFQMQGTNAPTALTDLMSGTGNLGGMGTGYGMQFDPSQGQLVPNVTATSFYNIQDNAFPMGTPIRNDAIFGTRDGVYTGEFLPAGSNTISTMPNHASNNYAVRVNTGDPGANPMGLGYNASAATAQNFDFPMGGRYNYFTNPFFDYNNSFSGIMNYDPYNALQLDQFGNPLSSIIEDDRSLYGNMGAGFINLTGNPNNWPAQAGYNPYYQYIGR